MDRELTDREKWKSRRPLIIKTAAALAVLAGGTIAVTSISGGSIDSRDLHLTAADRGVLEASVSASGRVVPAFEQTITSPIESRIVEVYAFAGDTLQTGTPLLLLDLQSEERELAAMLDQRDIKRLETEKARVNSRTHLSDLEMQLKVKEMTVDRLRAAVDNERRLDSLGSGTGEKVRQAQLAYDTGRLELEQLKTLLEGERDVARAASAVNDLDMSVFDSTIADKRRTLDDARLLSPRSATLTYIVDEIGRRVAPGEKLAVIADLRHFKIQGQVADTYADRLAPGQKAIVRIGGERIDGTVSSIEPSSTGGVVTFTVRLSQESHPKMRPGLSTDINLMTEVKDSVVRIPRGSYYKGPGHCAMWVADADMTHITRRDVCLGEGNFDYVEVLSGISPGEMVAINPPASDTRRSKLSIRNAKK